MDIRRPDIISLSQSGAPEEPRGEPTRVLVVVPVEAEVVVEVVVAELALVAVNEVELVAVLVVVKGGRGAACGGSRGG